MPVALEIEKIVSRIDKDVFDHLPLHFYRVTNDSTQTAVAAAQPPGKTVGRWYLQRLLNRVNRIYETP